jgi:hypothetical protein
MSKEKRGIYTHWLLSKYSHQQMEEKKCQANAIVLVSLKKSIHVSKKKIP